MINEQIVQPEVVEATSIQEQGTQSLNTELKPKISTCQELAKKSWLIYKENFKKLINLMLIPLVSFFVLGVLAIFSIIPIFLFHTSNNAIRYGLFVLVFIVLVFILFLFIYIAIATHASMFILIKNHKEKISVKEALKQGRKIVIKFFVTNLFIALFVCLWMFLLIIPGIYMTLAYSMAIWILINEGIGGLAALKKSKQLVKGYWFAIFGRYLVVYLFLYAVIMIPIIIFGEKSGLGLTWSFLSQIFSFLFAPFIMIYTYHIYLDLKKIKNI